MQIATISDSKKALTDTSTERVTSLMTRAGSRAIVQQNQQQFATFLADEQANSSSNADSSLERTSKSNPQSEDVQSNAATERTTTRENDQTRSEHGVRDTRSFDEDPPPADDTQDTYVVPSTDDLTSVREPVPQNDGLSRQEVTDETPQVPVDDSDTSDEAVQAEAFAIAAAQTSPLIPREVMTEATVVSTGVDNTPVTKSDPIDLVSVVASQAQSTETMILKSVIKGTTETVDPTISSPNPAKPITVDISPLKVESPGSDGNLVLSQITKNDEVINTSSEKSNFLALLAASAEAAASGDTKAVKDTQVSAGSTSTENLVITGTQTASGKSLIEMAVTFLPSNGRGGENAGPEDLAVSSENRSAGTTTPVVGLQALSTTKNLFSVRSGELTSTASTTTVVDLAAETVRYMTANGEKSMTVRLSPASLGDMRIEVSTVNDVLNVKLVSANSTARELLNQHVDLLRDTLAQGGLEVGSVTVTSGFGSTPNSHLSQQQSGSWSQGSSSAMPPGIFSRTGATEDLPVTRSRRVANYNGVLDVSI